MQASPALQHPPCDPLLHKTAEGGHCFTGLRVHLYTRNGFADPTVLEV